MSSAIFDPVKEFEHTYQALHLENTNAFWNELVCRSGVNAEENRNTIKEYHTYKENLQKLKRKLIWYRILRVLMVITIVLIYFVVTKMTPKIRALRSDIEAADTKVKQLYELAWAQMMPLNKLFTDRDALEIIHRTLPLLSFDPCFSMEKEANMSINYDFVLSDDVEESTLDVLSGSYNGNPFLFENKKVHTMGTKVYRGYKNISWEEPYTGSDGKEHKRQRSQRLEASVEKPCPYYETRVVLNYGSQAAPELTFVREATHLEQKSKKGLELYVKGKERELKRMANSDVGRTGGFSPMTNTKFEALFHAWNRNHEVQFRTLFTILGQKNMIDLITTTPGFGDDFKFIKSKRMNRIISDHSQNRVINVTADTYFDFSYDAIKDKFVMSNTDFFKDVYFDFAPLWAIPAYHDRPVRSLHPVPQYSQLYSNMEGEVLANVLSSNEVVHPDTKTPAILKSMFVRSKDGADEVRITAYSYDVITRCDIVPVRGGDGKYHNVTVEWDEYIPLRAKHDFVVSAAGQEADTKAMASKDGLCIYKLN